MPAQTDAAKALQLIEDSGFEMNAQIEAAHTIAQDREGEKIFDAIHAMVHRIEGDTNNASYWDRQAGTSLGGAGFEFELAALKDMAGI